MNKQQRNRIDEIRMKLADLMEDLMSIADEEDEKIENLPEGLRESERWQQAEENLSDLQDAIETLDDVCDTLSTIADDC